MPIKLKAYDYRGDAGGSKLMEARLDTFSLRILKMIIESPNSDEEKSMSMCAMGQALGALIAMDHAGEMSPEEMISTIRPYILSGATKTIENGSPNKKVYAAATDKAFEDLTKMVDTNPSMEDPNRPNFLHSLPTSSTRH